MSNLTPDKKALLEAFRACEPEVQTILMVCVRASFIQKTVPHEVTLPRAKALIARFRAGGEITNGDLRALVAPVPRL